MKNIKKISLFVLLIAIALVMAGHIILNDSALDVIATFLSITAGFTITALSIIATSSFSKELYKYESSNNNSKTLLHELIDKFRNATYIYFTSIVLIIIYKFIPIDNSKYCLSIFNQSSTVGELLLSVTAICTALSCYSFVTLFFMFTKFVSKTASK